MVNNDPYLRVVYIYLSANLNYDVESGEGQRADNSIIKIF